MSTTKFLFLYRTLPEAPQAGTALGTFQPSPQQMQEMWAQWSAWKAKFKDAILENEENMKPGGGAAVCKAGAVSDGPYIESKELLGGYTFIQADSLAHAIEIARECPITRQPGGSVEVRELVGREYFQRKSGK